MDINNINNTKQETTLITLRITTQLKQWLKEKNYSPTKIFKEACKDLGYNNENKNQTHP